MFWGTVQLLANGDEIGALSTLALHLYDVRRSHVEFLLRRLQCLAKNLCDTIQHFFVGKWVLEDLFRQFLNLFNCLSFLLDLFLFGFFLLFGFFRLFLFTFLFLALFIFPFLHARKIKNFNSFH